MTTLLAPLPVQSFKDSNGNPLAGGSLYTYAAGTSTPLATYTDSTGTTPNANPIVLNSRGEANIWLGGGLSYKFLLNDALGVLIWTVDQISSGGSSGNPITLASAATTDIGGQGTSAVEISGSATITSFGTNYNGPRFLRFTGASTLTQSASLNLPGGINITTAAGDTAIAYPNLALNGWNVVGYQLAAGNSIPVAPGYFYGLNMSTAGASATMSFSAGKATDTTSAAVITLAALAKTTASWALGTAAGGLDTGTIAINTWYHFYAIRRPDTGVTDIVFSLSATVPTTGVNVPAAYTQFQYLNSGRTNGSSQWTKFLHTGNDVMWDVPVNDVNAVNQGTAAVLRVLTVPTGRKCKSIVNLTMTNASTNYNMLFSDPDQGDNVPSSTLNTARLNSSATVYWTGITTRQITNASAQIRTRQDSSGASDQFFIVTAGFEIIRT